MEDKEINSQQKQIETPISKIDFGKVFSSSIIDGTEFSPISLGQSISDLKKENPQIKFDFSEESYKEIEEKYGKELADSGKGLFMKSLELSEFADRNEYFEPMLVNTFKNRTEGNQTLSKEVSVADQDKVFWKGNSWTPAQTMHFEEAADKNREYFDYDPDGNIIKKKLGESESYNDLINPFRVGFGASGLVIATNKFVAEFDPVIKKKIENGELYEDAYFTDENGDYTYRKVKDSEQVADKLRSVWGPSTVYNKNIFQEGLSGIYDGILSLADGAAMISHYAYKPYTLALRAMGNERPDEILENAFMDFSNSIQQLKSNGSMDEDRGWNYNLTNATKLIFNGIGQILPTMGAGFVAQGALKGVSGLSNLAKMGRLSPAFIGNVSGGVTRALNFGIAAKAGKEESLRMGLSKDESDLMGIIAGSIMVATEFATGSQFIPKMTGREAFKETAEKLAQHTVAAAKKSGVSVAEYVASNPGKIKGMISSAHKWLESPASGAAAGFAKGFTGEGIQEFTEDATFSMVKQGYDMITGTDTFDQDFEETFSDLMGSFVIGGFSGGMIKSTSSINGKQYKNDQIDEKRNNIYINEIASGRLKELIKAKEHLKKTGFGSKIFSINKDADGNKILLSKDKGLNAMSENDFLDKLFDEQIAFAKHAYENLKGFHGNKKQSLADDMSKYMDQIEDSQQSLGDVVKGARMMMDVEGMQLMRRKSLLQGHLVLEAAKSLGDKTVTKSLDTIEEIRIFNGKILAIKREGEDEFSLPTPEEQTVLSQFNRELLNNGDKGKGLQEMAKAARAFDKDLGKLKFELERMVKGNVEPALIEEKTKAISELEKEKEQAIKDLKTEISDRGMDETMADTYMDIDFANEFEQNIFDGSRRERYIENFGLNLMKASFPAVFNGREDYNVEDFRYDLERNNYFNTSTNLNNEVLSKISEENAFQVNEILSVANQPGFDSVAAMEQLSGLFANPSMVVNKETLDKVVEFFDSNKVEMSDQEVLQASEEIRLLYSKITSLANDAESFPQEVQFGISFDQWLKASGSTLKGQALFEAFMKTDPALTELAKSNAANFILPELDAQESRDLQEFTGNLTADIDRGMAVISKIQALNQYNMLRAGIDAKKSYDEKNASGNKVYDFALNQNRAFGDNYFMGESGIEDKIRELEGITDFIDSGDLGKLQSEIRSNGRYLIASKNNAIYNKVDESPEINESLLKLQELEKRIVALKEVSDKNRGNRFTRDYTVSMQYVKNSYDQLQAINKALGLGLEKELDQINIEVDPSEENKDEVHKELVKMIELEDEFSEKISGLPSATIEILFERLGLNQIIDLSSYVFQSVSEDNENPFEPDSKRDQAESMVNKLLLLSRNNTKDFFTFGIDYIRESIDITKENAPSREQILVARQLFSKMNREGNSNIENYLAEKTKGSKTVFSTTTSFLRGIAGSGKSSKVLNMAFDILSRKNAHLGVKPRVLYTAPNKPQVENIGKSLKKIGDKIDVVSFELGARNKLEYTDPTVLEIRKGNIKDVDVIVIDEATVFSGELILIISAVEKHNAKKGKQITVILAGDDLQQSKAGQLHNFMYTDAMDWSFERTTPLTTPFRTGKIDSFDLQMSHRKKISVMSRLLLMRDWEKKTFIVPATGEAIVIDSKEAKKKAYEEVLRTMKTKTSSKYYEIDGVVKNGIKGVATVEEVYDSFLNDFVSRDRIEPGDMMFITLPGNRPTVIKGITETARLKGLDISELDFDALVSGSDQIQGLEIKNVYMDILPTAGGDIGTHFIKMKAQYVSESREIDSLVMLSDEDHVSVKTAIEEDIIGFPPLDFNKKDSNNQIHPESAQLIENNEHIESLIESLAGNKPDIVPAKKTNNDNPVKENTVKETNKTKETTPPKAPDAPLKNDVLDEEGKATVNGAVNGITDAELIAAIEGFDISTVRSKDYKRPKFKNVCE